MNSKKVKDLEEVEKIIPTQPQSSKKEDSFNVRCCESVEFYAKNSYWVSAQIENTNEWIEKRIYDDRRT